MRHYLEEFALVHVVSLGIGKHHL